MASPIQKLIRRTVARGALRIAAYNRQRLPVPPQAHPFLSGIHAPMHEELSLEDLQVSGSIPPELDGSYLRIGPNPVTPPHPGAYHWFVGDGMVHGVRLQAGRALWYRNRWVRSRAVSQALGEAPAPGPRNGASDTVNTNVLGHAGKTWACVEAGAYPVQLDAELGTIAHDPFGGSLRGSFSAHPHRDPATGELHAICYDGRSHNEVRHVVVTSDGRVRREEPITVAHGPSIHDCMITPNHVIVFDLPVTFSLKTLLAGHAFPYAWNPAHRARVGLLPREGRGSDIVWCEVAPCYVFHPCNAFETGDGRVVVDVAAHDNMFAQSTQGPDSRQSAFERWTVDPAQGQVRRQVLDAQAQEFPRCDERRQGLPYRFAYTLPLAQEGAALGARSFLIKHDLHTGTRQTHEFGPHRVPGEFVFVPGHPGAREDEGWLLGLVVDMARQTTDLVILDAQGFSGPPRACVHIPHRIPAGFHGNWVATS